MNNQGWIKLDRKILDHWLMQDSSKFHAWMVMLLSVNFKDKKDMIDNDVIYCQRGSATYSVATWAQKFGKGWTNKKVRSFFKLLESESMIVYKGMRKTSHVTICNYDTYQESGNTEVTQREHRSNTEVTQRATREECKERKEGNNEVKKLEDRKDNFIKTIIDIWKKKKY